MTLTNGETQALGAVVFGSIINGDQLVAQRLRAHGRINPVDQGSQIVKFVIDGDDDGNSRRRHGAEAFEKIAVAYTT